MSLFQVYARALQYLAVHKFRVSAIVLANVVLAAITIAEPILFGRIIDAISSKGEVTPMLLMWAALGVFNTVAFVLVAREADRLAHGRRATLLTEAFGRIVSMPLSWHTQRGTSNALHTLLRACETLFGLWRVHAPASGHRRCPDAPDPDRLCHGRSPVAGARRARHCLCHDQQGGDEPHQGRPGFGREPLPHGFLARVRRHQQRVGRSQLQPHRSRNA